MAAPPPYDGSKAGYGACSPQDGYAQPPPPAGFAPPSTGYAPPSTGYAPPPTGYAPPPAGYAPPPAPYPAGYGQPAPGYAPQPAYAPQPFPVMGQQQQSNVTVVNAGGAAPVAQTIVVERRGVNHALHCIISLFFWPWLIVWIILCLSEGS